MPWSESADNLVLAPQIFVDITKEEARGDLFRSATKNDAKTEELYRILQISTCTVT